MRTFDNLMVMFLLAIICLVLLATGIGFFMLYLLYDKAETFIANRIYLDVIEFWLPALSLGLGLYVWLFCIRYITNKDFNHHVHVKLKKGFINKPKLAITVIFAPVAVYFALRLLFENATVVYLHHMAKTPWVEEFEIKEVCSTTGNRNHGCYLQKSDTEEEDYLWLTLMSLEDGRTAEIDWYDMRLKKFLSTGKTVRLEGAKTLWGGVVKEIKY